MKKSTASVKVSKSILKKVKDHVKITRHQIGGFYDLAVEEKMFREAESKPIKHEDDIRHFEKQGKGK